MNGRISVKDASKVLRMDCQTIRMLLRSGAVDWGLAFKRPGSRQYTYLIYSEKFKGVTGYDGKADE